MFSFDFSKTLKQIKIRVLALKLLLKTLLKTLEKVKKIALKNLERNMSRESIFIIFPKYRFEMIAQVCEKTKYFEKETIKKTFEKNF